VREALYLTAAFKGSGSKTRPLQLLVIPLSHFF
jgi:hypothetical protein